MHLGVRKHIRKNIRATKFIDVCNFADFHFVYYIQELICKLMRRETNR